jgi:hypothetical protein
MGTRAEAAPGRARRWTPDQTPGFATPTIARARVSIWLSRAAGKALRNDAQVRSYNGEVGMRFLLILITVFWHP